MFLKKCFQSSNSPLERGRGVLLKNSPLERGRGVLLKNSPLRRGLGDSKRSNSPLFIRGLGGFSLGGFLLLFLFFLPAFAEEPDTLWTKSTYPSDIRCLKFSPDDQYIAYGMAQLGVANLDPVVLNAETGEVFKVLKGHKDGWILDLDFHPNGLWLATASNSDEIIIWDYKTGEIVKRIEGLEVVHSVVFSHDGLKLYALDGETKGRLSAWSTVDWQKVYQGGFIDRRYYLECSSDGKYLASSYSDMYDNFDIDFYDAKTFQFVFSIRDAHERILTDIAFSPDGKYIASASRDGNAKIWDVETKTAIRVFENLTTVISVEFSKDSKYLITGDGGFNQWVLNIWDIETSKKTYTYIPPVNPNTTRKEAVLNVEVSYNNKYIAYGGLSVNVLSAKWETSNIQIENKDDNIKIIPNPVADNIDVLFNVINTGEYIIKLADLIGNEHYSKSLFLESGEQRIVISARSIPSGTYLLTINGKNYSKSVKCVVVK